MSQLNKRSPTSSSIGKLKFQLVTRIFFFITLIVVINPIATMAQSPCLPCPPDIIVAATSDCSARVVFPPPNLSGCLTSSIVTYSHQSGSLFPLGSTTVTINVYDLNNIIYASCSFQVIVVDKDPPVINCPQDITVTTAPGQTGANVNFAIPKAMDNCNNTTVTASIPSGSFFPLGTTLVSLRASDQSGNSASCSFKVTVVDKDPPVISCPADVVTTLPTGQCSMRVEYPAPTVKDNAGVVSITSNPPSGSLFSRGTTNVIVMATDRAGNVATCSFNVTVIDNSPPLIDCPNDITVTAPAGVCSLPVSYPSLKVRDNCPVVKIVYSIQSGAHFSVGTTPVNVRATDEAGNIAICSFKVTVLDNSPPVINCPANIITTASSGNCTAIVNYPRVDVIDECNSATLSYSQPSGTPFPLGNTIVTVTATDAASNKSQCSFTVTVDGVAEANLSLADNQSVLTFGPIVARRAPRKRPAFGLFTVENTGCATLNMALTAMQRTGKDVDNGTIVQADDSNLFLIRMGSPTTDGWPFLIGQQLSVTSKDKYSFYLLFNPLIPPVARRTDNLTAREVLPEIIHSRITMEHNSGEPMVVNVIGRIDTALRLIDPIDPGRAPKIALTRSGDELTAEFSIYDANLDVNRATFQFFNSAGQVVGTPINVDLTTTIRESNLVKGQSFTVAQRFSGANDNSEISSVRVTIFDNESSEGATSSTVMTNSNVAGQSSTENERVTVTLPEIRLMPIKR